MSYDIFLACVRGEDTVRFKPEIFEEIFLPHCPYLKSYRADRGMQVEYPDGSHADISIDNSSEEEEQARRLARTPEERVKLPAFPPGDRDYIEFLGFGGHFGGASFFKDLYELADRVGAMVYAGGAVIVAKESVLKEIPEDFLGMENARVMRNAAELEEAVFARNSGEHWRRQ